MRGPERGAGSPEAAEMLAESDEAQAGGTQVELEGRLPSWPQPPQGATGRCWEVQGEWMAEPTGQVFGPLSASVPQSADFPVATVRVGVAKAPCRRSCPLPCLSAHTHRCAWLPIY